MPVARARKLKGVPRGGPFCRSWWITSDARAEQDLAEVISASGGRPEPAELSPAPTWTLPLDAVPDPKPSDYGRDRKSRRLT
jgi:hypothetical protein